MKRLYFFTVVVISLLFLNIIFIKTIVNANNKYLDISKSKSLKSNKSIELLKYNKPKKGKLIWSDEFDGTTLDATKWVYEIGNGCPNLCGWGNSELQYYTKENIKVDNGKLIITAQRDENLNPIFTSGRIKTEGKMELMYGRIDVSAKLPKGKGIWPAIWMLGTSIRTLGWPVCGEIDIMELRGSSPEKICGTVHYNNKSNKHEFVTPECYSLKENDFSNKFHLFSIVWDKEGITWLVDDIPYMKLLYSELNMVQENNAFKNEFYVILNLAIGGRYDGNPTVDTKFPQTMEIDYIRIYK